MLLQRFASVQASLFKGDMRRPGGKVLFVDYHRPVPWHPLRPVMAAVFRWLEPFADGLVSRPITDFAAHPQDFHWRKETRFGGLYQKMVAKRLR